MTGIKAFFISSVSIIFLKLIFVNNVDAQNQTLSPEVESVKDYSFIVAGHAYGSHQGNNIGLYPKLLKKLKQAPSAEFIVFTGDIVRLPATQNKWQQVEKEIADLNLPAFYVMGNNDYSESAMELFKKKFADTYYSFDIGSERFIILDSQKQTASISPDQLDFLKESLGQFEGENVFIFFHELLWNNHLDYRNIMANNRSRYGHPDLTKSNYWSDIHPLLESHSDKNIFVIAGDVGGRPDSVPAFYQKINHLTLIASGMGEIRDENYLKVSVKNARASFELIALNRVHTLKPLQEYTIENLSSQQETFPYLIKDFINQPAVRYIFTLGFFISHIWL